jgi:hypothetical protein
MPQQHQQSGYQNRMFKEISNTLKAPQHNEPSLDNLNAPDLLDTLEQNVENIAAIYQISINKGEFCVL